MSKVYITCPELQLSKHETAVHSSMNVQMLYDYLSEYNVLQCGFTASMYLTKNGLCVFAEDCVYPGDEFTMHFRIRGGKGGFGSMLRALGSQIEKTTNKEACRDLSGRRMRDVNNEKKMMEWIKLKAEKDQEKEKEKIEKLERQLQKPKHFFNDPNYEKQIESTAEALEDSLKKGLAASKRNLNGNNKKEQPVAKKSKLWLGMDDISDDSESDDSSDNEGVSHHVVALTKSSGLEAGSSSKTDDTQLDEICKPSAFLKKSDPEVTECNTSGISLKADQTEEVASQVEQSENSPGISSPAEKTCLQEDKPV